jgi:hypothetical protein
MPRLDGVMQQIESLGHGTEEYHEAMWMLLSVRARRQAIIADRLRAERIRRERRAETRGGATSG